MSFHQLDSNSMDIEFVLDLEHDSNGDDVFIESM